MVVFLSDTPFLKGAHSKVGCVDEIEKIYPIEIWDLSLMYGTKIEGERVDTLIDISDSNELIENLERIIKNEKEIVVVTAMKIGAYALVYPYFHKYRCVKVVCFDKESYGKWVRRHAFYEMRNILPFKLKIKTCVQHITFFSKLYNLIRYKGAKYDYALGVFNFYPETNRNFVRMSCPDLLPEIELTNIEIKGKYALFVDTAITTHPAYDLLEKKPDKNKYLKVMNAFFDSFEKAYGLPVVIAEYPKVKYEDSDWKGRKIVRGKTQQYIKDAEVILSHTSSAIFYAILKRKKMIFVQYEDMLSGTLLSFGAITKWISLQLGCTLLNAEEAVVKNEIIVHEELYQAFEEKYIKPKQVGEKTNSDILLEVIKNIMNDR